jgi:hypothetical protein
VLDNTIIPDLLGQLVRITSSITSPEFGPCAAPADHLTVDVMQMLLAVQNV